MLKCLKTRTIWGYFFVYFFIAFLIVVIDQLTKWTIVDKMAVGESIPVIENFFYITSHRNRGAAWGILQNQMALFYLITIAAAAFMVYYLYKNRKGSRWLNLGLSFMLGGALGNFIDRLFRKEVVDFFDFRIFSYHYPIFNVADSALVTGVFILIFYMFAEEWKGKKERQHGNL
ncbi:MAG: lipoprotein signal peptidase [Caldibacillus debilis]|uniref:Lipoprotein signal peptidase n=1 Tax=Caldibacillus debilis GB1 TaxID=1339248 RepID=A0A420VJQ3_9BACI|nr:signal peptidase II [Caldibacillus debilis]MBO2480491.1 lipoprotein signal peptidase [Bacillaceae bacterium]REJ13777.1 MAG: lipoprotein signal peptidase [Caldibacillus debilis]REJ27997.1 MAG: lipoprotein signal peptidase [Caldibacillus debilis]RKO63911.1 signal peptidase II [Caldibacillus debilis GB1]